MVMLPVKSEPSLIIDGERTGKKIEEEPDLPAVRRRSTNLKWIRVVESPQNEIVTLFTDNGKHKAWRGELE